VREVVSLRNQLSGQSPRESSRRLTRIDPPRVVSLEGASLRGSRKAALAIVEYSDFECPYCRAFHLNDFRDVLNRFVDTGRALYAFRHFPLERIHPASVDLAVAARCAGEQGRFWEVVDLLFLRPGLAITPEALGVQAAEFGRCRSGSGLAAVAADRQQAADLGVRGTPTFLVGQLQPNLTVAVRASFLGGMAATEFAAVVDGFTDALVDR
jgi:protein-disulfide isomerase